MIKRVMVVSIEIVIDDEAQLRRAATERAVYEGIDLEDWEDTRNGPGDDLIMLIDPGMVEGCSIVETSTAEVPE